MRSRLLFTLLPFLPLVVACSDTDRPVSLDLVGSSRFTSGNRTASAGDTITTRIYAVGNDNQSLTRMRVTVSYEPESQPITYPVPATSFDVTKIPTDLLRVYLDTALTTREFVLQPTFGVRTTSGTERWEFTATDQQGNSASRAFRVTVRKTDSLTVVHSYTLSLLAPTGSFAARASARRYLALLPGLALPNYSVRQVPSEQNAENQKLIDLQFIPGDTVALATLDYPRSATARWANRRATQLHRTSLSPNDFTNATTAALLQQAFDNNPTTFPVPTSTGLLTANQIIAFKTADGKYGMIQVVEILRTPYSSLKISVRIQK